MCMSRRSLVMSETSILASRSNELSKYSMHSTCDCIPRWRSNHRDRWPLRDWGDCVTSFHTAPALREKPQVAFRRSPDQGFVGGCPRLPPTKSRLSAEMLLRILWLYFRSPSPA